MDNLEYSLNLQIDFNAQQDFNNNTIKEDLKNNNENPEVQMRTQH